MTNLLAIDTATDALSLALAKDGELRTLHRVMPRQQQQQLFACLAELVGDAPLRGLGLDAIAFGRGPGSFTGLRIAASAAQGLAFSLSLPVISLSTLETQARTLLRRERPVGPARIISTIDARIGRLYAASFDFDGDTLYVIDQPALCAATDWAMPAGAAGSKDGALWVIGSGAGALRDAVPALADARFCAELLPEARDMLAPAEHLLHAGASVAPALAIPDYVQTRVGWKKLAEQGRRA